MKLTEAQLLKRVERWQQRLSPLGVGHFRIEWCRIVDETPSNCGANATTAVATHYDTVHFWFQREALEASDAQTLDERIIHEWLHVAHRDADEALMQVESWMPRDTYRDFDERMEHEYEGFIDRVSRALYAFFHGS